MRSPDDAGGFGPRERRPYGNNATEEIQMDSPRIDVSTPSGLGGAWCAHCYVFTKSDAAGRLNAHPLRGGECPGSHHTGFSTVPTDTPPCDRPASPSPSYLRVVAAIEAADPCRDLRAEVEWRRAQAARDAAEMERVADLYLAARADLTQAENDARHAHSEWSQERAANRRLRDELSALRAAANTYRSASVAALLAERDGDPAELRAARATYNAAACGLSGLLPHEVADA